MLEIKIYKNGKNIAWYPEVKESELEILKQKLLKKYSEDQIHVIDITDKYNNDKLTDKKRNLIPELWDMVDALLNNDKPKIDEYKVRIKDLLKD